MSTQTPDLSHFAAAHRLFQEENQHRRDRLAEMEARLNHAMSRRIQLLMGTSRQERLLRKSLSFKVKKLMEADRMLRDAYIAIEQEIVEAQQSICSFSEFKFSRP